MTPRSERDKLMLMQNSTIYLAYATVSLIINIFYKSQPLLFSELGTRDNLETKN